ncbi:MAG: FecR domain-containing protein [Tannerella sp.]|jgi:ferric-dicitrate binding protein FerR (iron transport regulator)|nr:FecR domain-containing protein [Tannerella sp.]
MVDYSKYKVEDFLQDDYFIHSMRHPTTESIAFWKKLTEESAVSSEEFNFAKYYISLVFAEKSRMTDIELNHLFKRIEADTVQSLRRKRKTFFFRAAASFLLLLAGAASVMYYLSEKKADSLVMAGLQGARADSEYVELILSDEERITITEDDASVDYAQKGKILINDKTLEKAPELPKSPEKKKTEKDFNQLIVPFGKRSSLTLEDGTHIWINAGTRVVYPVTFDDDKREIYVDGEIYTDVAKEAGRPFYVKTSGMQVLALGTSFNVTAYESDDASSVVLVNGSVQVKNKDRRTQHVLKPNDMLTEQNGRVHIRQVKATNHIAWIDGVYISDNETLESILLRLSRYYNVKITVDGDASGLLCSGKLEMKENIIGVFDVLSSTAPVTYKTNRNGDYHFMFNPFK